MTEKNIREQKKPLKIISKFKIEGATFARNLKRETVKNKKLKHSSKMWMERHINDEFTQKAHALGFRARSAFKIQEIHDKFDIFNLGRRYLKTKVQPLTKVLDLGCAPGGWSQVIVQNTKACLVGVDLLKTDPIEGLEFYQGDFTSPEIREMLASKYGKFQLILSDIAPNTSGQKAVDSLNLIAILEKEWEFVNEFLEEGGCFVCKVFRSGAEGELLHQIKKHFEFVKHFKPKSSRSASNEFYIVALKFSR